VLVKDLLLLAMFIKLSVTGHVYQLSVTGH